MNISRDVVLLLRTGNGAWFAPSQHSNIEQIPLCLVSECAKEICRYSKYVGYISSKSQLQVGFIKPGLAKV